MTNKEAIAILSQRGWDGLPCGYTGGYIEALDMAVEALKSINEMPSAERKGKWMEMGTNMDGTHNIKCSKCGEGYKTRGHARSIATKTKYKYCPNCGADMRGEEDE